MRSEVPVSLLKPHPKNGEYFSRPSPEKYEEIKRSVAAEGIRDPLKVTPDYMVIAGHLRLEIAKELGFEKVPVQIVDGDPEYLEYLLIADNEERRYCDDPIKKAKRAEFLKRYWGVRQGGDRRSKEKNSPLKTLDDVAREVGEDVSNLKKLLKLNDLIPELQHLVSQGKLGTTAAYSLAMLPPEEQGQLLQALGEAGVAGLSVKEAQELRKELDAVRAEREALSRRVAELEKEKTFLVREADERGKEEVEELKKALAAREEELEGLRARLRELEQKPVEKVVEKVVYRADPALEAELEAARAEAAKLLQEKEWFEGRFREVAQEKERKEAKIRALEEEVAKLQQRLDHAWTELKKERERPRPRFDVRKEEFRVLAQKAQTAAFELSELLKKLEEQYSDELLAASRVRGGPDFEDIGDAVVDTTVFKVLRTALEMALKRITNIFELLEGGKPKLQLVKGKEKDGR
ncbi:ParB/RepB/Spo0J family partition protein [Desulfovirgula thermocuniculi]|uniref:ParB/RepB/Spo0J family partition protein n=1 Tax=Desulfovirgula thermocuniculi TaxID=348842 RepID=UPI0012EB9F85|nr:ParB N-terminal domain-containing protein [Desulfovirgula thermocuniculi]